MNFNFKKAAQKWSLVVNNFDFGIKIENTKTMELFCIYMEYIANPNTEYETVLEIRDATIKKIKDFDKYTEIKIVYNEITGSIEYRTIVGNVFIKMNILSEETIKSIFGDEFFQFLVNNDYDF